MLPGDPAYRFGGEVRDRAGKILLEPDDYPPRLVKHRVKLVANGMRTKAPSQYTVGSVSTGPNGIRVSRSGFGRLRGGLIT